MRFAYTILLRFLCAFLVFFSLLCSAPCPVFVLRLLCSLDWLRLTSLHFTSPSILPSGHPLSNSIPDIRYPTLRIDDTRSGMHVYGPLCRFRGQGACFLTGEFRVSFLGLVLCFRRASSPHPHPHVYQRGDHVDPTILIYSHHRGKRPLRLSVPATIVPAWHRVFRVSGYPYWKR
jgi:hypothetical protein